jgi:hypothetical protein
MTWRLYNSVYSTVPRPYGLGDARYTLIYKDAIPWPGGEGLQRIITVFGKKEFATIRAYCRENDLSLYALAKSAIREYIQRHS